MGPTSTGAVWPSLLIGIACVVIAALIPVAIARHTAPRAGEGWIATSVLAPLDRCRHALAGRRPGGVTLLAALVAVAVALASCLATLAVGQLTKLSLVIDIDRPTYRFFLHHRQEWLTDPLSWATHVGEYPEMTAIALGGALVIGPGITRARFLVTVILSAALMPLLTSIGHAYNWVDVGAFIAFLALAALTRRNSWLMSAVLMTTMPIEKHLQSALTQITDGSVPSAADAVGGVGPYPSGGCTRIVLVCGVVGYLLARSYRSRRASVGISVVCTVIAVFEAFTRIYLGKHWPVDAFGGLFFGATLLLAFIAGIRTYLGPVHRLSRARAAVPAVIPQAAS